MPATRILLLLLAAAALAGVGAWLALRDGDPEPEPPPAAREDEPPPFGGAVPQVEGRVLLAGCRQGQCVWSRIVRLERVRSVPQGELRRIDLRRGTSLHQDEPPQAFAPGLAVEWEAQEESHYVFCSTQRPAYAFPDRDGGGLIVHFLDPFRIAGFEYASARAYLRYCHDAEFTEGDETALRRLGYRPGTRSEQVEGAAPADLVRF